MQWCLAPPLVKTGGTVALQRTVTDVSFAYSWGSSARFGAAGGRVVRFATCVQTSSCHICSLWNALHVLEKIYRGEGWGCWGVEGVRVGWGGGPSVFSMLKAFEMDTSVAIEASLSLSLSVAVCLRLSLSLSLNLCLSVCLYLSLSPLPLSLSHPPPRTLSLSHRPLSLSFPSVSLSLPPSHSLPPSLSKPRLSPSHTHTHTHTHTHC